MKRAKQHHYSIQLLWEGNKGNGTANYATYGREHKIYGDAKTGLIEGSSDPSFLGDASKYNPEELLLSSLASCHMLWYLHLCATAKIIVTAYSDRPEGTMIENADGSGQFDKVVLRPVVKITKSENLEKAKRLHKKAHEMCFIARSCNFLVMCEETVTI